MAYLSEIERGLKEPSSEILAAVCGALDATILGLVGAAHEELREVQELRVVPTTRSVLAAATSVVPTRSGGAVLLAA
jgi:transcriptional regulator with XRE-family HTH domain